MSNRPQQAQGFILVLTLALLVVLATGAAYIAQWSQQAVAAASQEDQIARELSDFYSTLNSVVYLHLVYHMTKLGLNLDDTREAQLLAESIEGEGMLNSTTQTALLLLDDRPYHGLSNNFFSVQDEGGLINPQQISSYALARALEDKGISNAQAEALVSKLKDYTDADDVYRLNGAEAEQYQQAGLPPPPNRRLLSTRELQRVLGWSALPQLWENDVQLRWLTVAPRNNIIANPNTAPLIALRSVPGVENDRIAQRIQAGRPYRDFTDISLAAGVPLEADAFDVNLFPERFLRITLWNSFNKRAREVHARLTPYDSTSPWKIDYALDIAQINQPSSAMAALVKHPLFAAAPVVHKR